jgi:hypothetical protein
MDQLKTPLVKRYGIVALVRYQGHGIKKPFPEYGHLSIVTYVRVPTIPMNDAQLWTPFIYCNKKLNHSNVLYTIYTLFAVFYLLIQTFLTH